MNNFVCVRDAKNRQIVPFHAFDMGTQKSFRAIQEDGNEIFGMGIVEKLIEREYHRFHPHSGNQISQPFFLHNFVNSEYFPSSGLLLRAEQRSPTAILVQRDCAGAVGAVDTGVHGVLFIRVATTSQEVPALAGWFCLFIWMGNNGKKGHSLHRKCWQLGNCSI